MEIDTSERETILETISSRGRDDPMSRKALRAYTSSVSIEEVLACIAHASATRRDFLVKWGLKDLSHNQAVQLRSTYSRELQKLCRGQAEMLVGSFGHTTQQTVPASVFDDDSGLFVSVGAAANVPPHPDDEITKSWNILASFLSFGVTLEPCPTVEKVFRFALMRPCRPGLVTAVLLREMFTSAALDEIVAPLELSELQWAARLLRVDNQPAAYRLSCDLVRHIRRRGLEQVRENARLIRTTPRRLQRLDKLCIGDVLGGCQVVSVEKFGVFVKFGDDDDALIHMSDLAWDEAHKEKVWPHVGERVDAVVLEVLDWSGNVLLGIKQLKVVTWLAARERFAVGSRASGLIKKKTQHHLHVDLGEGVMGLVSASEFADAGLDYVFESHEVGTSITAVVVSANHETRHFVLSRVQTLPAELRNAPEPGTRFIGRVTEVTKAGAKIELPRKRMAQLPAAIIQSSLGINPSALQIGQAIEVEVLKSLKPGVMLKIPDEACLDLEAAWEDAISRCAVGSVIEVTVEKIVPYGAFVTIGPAVSGLIHVDEVAWGKVARVADHVELGQQVKVKVLNVDTEKKRVALSLRALLQDPWPDAASRFPLGTEFVGRIENILGYGIFITVSKGVSGFIHISSLKQLLAGREIEERFVKQEEIRCRVVSVDPEARRMNLEPAL